MPLLQLHLEIFDIPLGTDTYGLLLGFVKLLLIIGGILYLIYSGVIIRQIQLMKSTIESNFSNHLIFISFINLAFAIIVLSYFLLL